MRLRFSLFALILFVYTVGYAQVPKPLPPGEILLNLKKLNVLGSVLYVAAHPDDENTIMLSWLAKERLARTGYLSLTRGDGGQNLIGSEQADLMGLIRTYELLGARAIDGPEQYFSRANDFGFSKNTEETLDVWGKNTVLADIVWRIRNFRPDVMICRFPPDPRAGHGNHSASAYLAEEAFKMAGDPTQFPEQLKFVKPWQPKRILWNTFAFGINPAQRPSEGSWISVEIGGYNPLLGISYPELAAESRSQHKSQGFGVAKSRGLKIEYLVHKNGDKATKDLFEGVETSWKRVKGGEAVQRVITQAMQEFKPEQPSAIVPLLVQVYQLVNKLDDAYWKEQKKKELSQLIVACAGLYYESNPSKFAVAGGEGITLTTTIIKRSDIPVTLKSVRFKGFQKDTTLHLSLPDNELQRFSNSFTIPLNQPITQPYWLLQPKMSKGMYRVDELAINGLPEKPADFQTEFSVDINGLPLTLQVPVTYKYTDAVRGELYRPFEVRPVITATPSDKVLVFPDGQPKSYSVMLKASKANVSGQVSLELPKGWRSEPTQIPVDFTTKFQEQTVTFQLIPPKEASDASVKVVVKTKDEVSSRGLYEIGYEHIPPLAVFPAAETKLVRLAIQNKAKTIGYIPGAGDEIPAALRQMGCSVTLLGEKELTGSLAAYDAIVVGVRAYNVNPRMNYYQPRLMEYVKNGGTMIVQYQVNSGIQPLEKGMGPYSFHLSRDRVTVEEAEMRLLQPNHPIVNTPNKITDADFKGWVQERGLYFADQWAPEYQTIFSSNDPNEQPLNGGMLATQYGKGWYVFTGYAFFRQLPAGVPGAYRLFANLISLGK
ncbi:PIG-L family deacetylase [Siphonobacter sp. SORGH_AS_1065]|uniref:PIG-L family deacetylase n=1 Tax=Siphonobacter sp. SORGH_AS_1065 TaxID=3041795 RepID=UPI00278A834B|nr:PIG-L family deacetylase [Siphonobacter sp. SORGH_AS_1065]MDQ1088905.1 LmbE family N-acetylglucosaminyl deacetylase [Siphonobacter sp. SORGH_AS_1065]